MMSEGMARRLGGVALVLVLGVGLLAACQPAATGGPQATAGAAGDATGATGGGTAANLAAGLPRVLAVESFLADIAQNVAGDRLEVATLMPLGLDPHAFEPTPQDVARISEASVLIINGAGFEEWMEVLDNAGGERLLIEAAAGLESRTPGAEEITHDHGAGETHADETHADEAHADETHADEAHADETHADEAHTDEAHTHEGDPHFWLDPTKVVRYVENIRDGLSAADPAGAETYAANAAAYIAELEELDVWIAEQIAQIPPERRLLVTNHESLGYYADRYGLEVIGAVVPSVTTGASPSAQQLAALADLIRAEGAPAIFLETGANDQLAQQLHDETGIAVVTGIYTHSITEPAGAAPTYLAMMRYNTEAIVTALR
jgi:ABC-type Zn uptake system ZnuABC Zn-binding protein ZnuA